MSACSRWLRRSLLPTLRAGLALACVAAHLAGTAHFALTRHELCAEHGEAVHVSAAHLHTHLARAVNAPTHTSIGAGSGAEKHTRHAHCAVAGTQRDRASVAASDGTVALAPAARGITLTRHVLASPDPIPLLALAPKSSPPV